MLHKISLEVSLYSLHKSATILNDNFQSIKQTTHVIDFWLNFFQ